MANLGPQKINLSYDGLLQVPGGITASLQTVTDGNGNASGVQISSTGFSGQITSNGAVITGGSINGTPIGATTPSTGKFTSLIATGTTTLNTSLTGILKGTSGVVGLASAGTDYVSPAVLGAANGVATLGSDSKLTASQVPAIAVTEYLGAVASQSAMLALTGQAGDWCTRTDLGTNWVITGSNPSVLADWTQLSYPTAPVISVNGLTGAVSLSYTNVGAAPATTGSSILYANGSGGFSNVTVGSGLSFVGGTLTSSAAGTVTSASVVTANGFAGTVANASSTPAITLTTTVSGLLKGNGTAISAAVADTDYQSVITATGILKGAGAGSISAATSGTDYAPGTSALATGILKSTTSTGALSIAVVGTDYAPATTGTSILKGNGTGGFSSAVSGTDYAPATSGTSILKGNGSGGFSNATSGTDYAPATSGSSILYGNGSGGFSNVTVGSGLSFVGGTLASTSAGGSVTTVSVVTANGFAGTVANASSTPAITLTTSVTGLLKGNGTAVSAAVSGTDYAPATSGTAILKGNGSGGFNSAAAGTDYAVPTSGSSILYGNGSGGFSNVTVGSGLSFAGGTLSNSGAMTYPGAGMAVSTGSAWGTSKTTPTGDVVGTSDTQTLTNKTLTAAGSNTVEATSGPTSTQLAGQRNKIINGAMMIDQRNAGASVTPTAGAYTLDRWTCQLSQSGKLSIQQNAGSVTPPVGFSNYLGVTSLSAYSIGAGDYFSIRQLIEGYNIADLSWGTSSAKSVTLSFQVYSSLTGTFGGVLTNSNYSRSYPFIYTISSANTWTPISITIAGDTTGTWQKTNSGGINVEFGLGVGSTYSGTAGSWSGNAYDSATGATSVVGTNGATFYITGVQLEKGATATPFENRLYGTELALCQRYYETSFDIGTAPANNVNDSFQALSNGASTNNTQAIPFKVTKRSAPTMTYYSSSVIASPTAGRWQYMNGSAWVNSTTTAINRASTTAHSVYVGTSGLSSGFATSVAGHWVASSEL